MDDFFTIASFGTLAGCVIAVVLIVNALRHALNWGPRWFGFLLSILVSVIALQILSNLGDESKTVNLGLWIKYFIVFINGCLIYTSAFGLQSTIIHDPSSKSKRITFRSNW